MKVDAHGASQKLIHVITRNRSLGADRLGKVGAVAWIATVFEDASLYIIMISLIMGYTANE